MEKKFDLQSHKSKHKLKLVISQFGLLDPVIPLVYIGISSRSTSCNVVFVVILQFELLDPVIPLVHNYYNQQVNLRQIHVCRHFYNLHYWIQSFLWFIINSTIISTFYKFLCVFNTGQILLFN